MEYTKAWNERQERLHKEQEDKKEADLEGIERRLPDKMPVPRNTAVVYEDTASASVSQASQEQYSHENTGSATSAKLYCPCCPAWLYTPQKEEKAYRNAVYNASRVPTREQRCVLWQGGELPGENDVPQHLDLPSTDPADK
eukprot:360702-Amphidinium_carterae.1